MHDRNEAGKPDEAGKLDEAGKPEEAGSEQCPMEMDLGRLASKRMPPKREEEEK